MMCVIFNEKHEEVVVELTQELIQNLERQAEAMSREYYTYVVSIEWDTYHNLPFVEISGPYDC